MKTFRNYNNCLTNLPSTLTSMSSNDPDTLLIVKWEVVETGALVREEPLTSGKSPSTWAAKGDPETIIYLIFNIYTL